MLYSVLFRFGHIRRSDQCAVYILYSTDPGLLKIRHAHRFVAVVIQFLIPLSKKNTVRFKPHFSCLSSNADSCMLAEYSRVNSNLKAN